MRSMRRPLARHREFRSRSRPSCRVRLPPFPSGRAGGSCRARSHRLADGSFGSTTTPPVGKSGPGRRQKLGRRRLAILDQVSAASQSSAALCGGIEVAMPTAIPCEPLASRFGKAEGSTTGSSSPHHKFAEIDGVLVDPFQQEARYIGKTRLRVALGRGIVAVDRAIITLAVDKRIALRKVLRDAHHRVVDRLVPMRMEFADDIADDARGFLMAGPDRAAKAAWRAGYADARASARRGIGAPGP